MSTDRPSKKPYRPPRLVVHGKLRDLTQGAGKGGMSSDAGGQPKTRTGGMG